MAGDSINHPAASAARMSGSREFRQGRSGSGISTSSLHLPPALSFTIQGLTWNPPPAWHTSNALDTGSAGMTFVLFARRTGKRIENKGYFSDPLIG